MYSGTYLEGIVSKEELEEIAKNDSLEILDESELNDDLWEIRIYSKLPLKKLIGEQNEK